MPYEEVQHDVAERNNRATAWTPSHQKFRSLKEAGGVLYTFSLKQGQHRTKSTN